MLKRQVEELHHKLSGKSPKEILRELKNFFPEETISFSSSLSAEDQLITHYIFSQNLKYSVFVLDTGRLFPELYTLLASTQKKYNYNIEVYYPNFAEIEAFVKEKGINSFYSSFANRKECCKIRKVMPLNRALKGKKLWITGLKNDSINRENISLFEENQERIKCNPLYNYSYENVMEEIKKENVEISSLYQKGYKSIGCQPCTRAIKEGEDIRAGRWWWEDSKSKKECGLHIKQ